MKYTFRKDIFSKDDFANTQVLQFGNIHDFLRGDIIIEGITLGQHVSQVTTDITLEANGPVFDFEIGEYLFFVNKRGIVYSVEGPIPCFIANLYNYCWDSGCRAMDLIQIVSELSNNVWEKEPHIDYDDSGEEITIWEQSSLIGPINSKGVRVTIIPNIESDSGWKVESITFEIKGYENMQNTECMTYQSFCEIISTAVENRILLWHGGNVINLTQASKLLQNGYMLGGFIVDVGGSSIIMPGLLSILSMRDGRPRISNQEFKRDDESLYKFYQNYELDYDECKNADELNSLQSLITKDLYERSITAIRLTCAFGG